MASEKTLDGNIRAVLSTLQGREVIWEILSICDIYSPVSGKYSAGKRAVGLEILNMLEEADKELYPNLLLTMNNND